MVTGEVVRGGVYLAGPSGFSESGRLWHETVVVPAVAGAGLVALDPWAGQSAIADVLSAMDFGPARRDALRAANLEQGRYDLALLDRAEAVLAVLDGQDVDSGTAVEIGYAHARGRIVVGVRTDVRRCSDNEGATVNLMIETCATDSGGLVTTSLGEAVRHLAARLGVGPRPR